MAKVLQIAMAVLAKVGEVFGYFGRKRNERKRDAKIDAVVDWRDYNREYDR